MTMNNIQTSFFENVEQYAAFYNAWTNAVNDPRRKPKVVKHSETRMRRSSIYVEWTTERVPGWITGAHHVLYNIIRNKPLEHGFILKTNNKDLQCGHHENHGFYQACNQLRILVGYCRKIVDEETAGIKEPDSSDHVITLRRAHRQRVKTFLEPFNGTVTFQHLARLYIPTVIPINKRVSESNSVYVRKYNSFGYTDNYIIGKDLNLQMLWHNNFHNKPLNGVALFDNQFVWFEIIEEYEEPVRYTLYKLTNKDKEELIKSHYVFRELVGTNTTHHPTFFDPIITKDTKTGTNNFYQERFDLVNPTHEEKLGQVYWFQFRFWARGNY